MHTQCALYQTKGKANCMCVIVYTKEKSKLDLKNLESCHTQNQDGWGFMYTDGNRVFHSKYYNPNRVTQWKEFEKLFAKIPDKMPLAIHFRIRTMGDISKDNCHPFEILRKNITKDRGIDLWMMHNGSFSIKSPAGAKDSRSDTAMFVDSVLQPQFEVHREFLEKPAFKLGLHFMVGNNNRLLFMDSLSRVHIINKDQWTEKDDVLYSNMYWERHKSNHHSNAYDYRNYVSRHKPKDVFNNPEAIAKIESLLGDVWEKKAEGVWHYIGPKVIPKTGETQSGSVPVVVREDVSLVEAMKIASDTAPAKQAEVTAELQARLEVSEANSTAKEVIEAEIVDIKSKERIVEVSMNSALKEMTENEILGFMFEYPALTAKWMISRGFSGGQTAVEKFCNNNPDYCCTWIYNRARGIVMERVQQGA